MAKHSTEPARPEEAPSSIKMEGVFEFTPSLTLLHPGRREHFEPEYEEDDDECD